MGEEVANVANVIDVNFAGCFKKEVNAMPADTHPAAQRMSKQKEDIRSFVPVPFPVFSQHMPFCVCVPVSVCQCSVQCLGSRGQHLAQAVGVKVNGLQQGTGSTHTGSRTGEDTCIECRRHWGRVVWSALHAGSWYAPNLQKCTVH